MSSTAVTLVVIAALALCVACCFILLFVRRRRKQRSKKPAVVGAPVAFQVDTPSAMSIEKITIEDIEILKDVD